MKSKISNITGDLIEYFVDDFCNGVTRGGEGGGKPPRMTTSRGDTLMKIKKIAAEFYKGYWKNNKRSSVFLEKRIG